MESASMSMRSLHLGFELDFDSPEDREDSEDILLRLMGINARLNAQFLRKNPQTLPLYESGVVYAKPDQNDGRRKLTRSDTRRLIKLLKEFQVDPETGLMVLRIIRGVECFLDIPTLYARGKGDCNELVPVRLAELWNAGVPASPYLVPAPNDKGGISYHAVVLHQDGSTEDPSAVLGMLPPADRAEEVRKNFERWSNYMNAAEHLVQNEGAPPKLVADQVDAMGLVPRDGVFRSPYGK